jgi:hypothetical protein
MQIVVYLTLKITALEYITRCVNYSFVDTKFVEAEPAILILLYTKFV